MSINLLLSTLDQTFYQNLSDNLYYNHEFLPICVSVFLLGLAGFLESRDFLSVLVNTEVMMLATNFHLITNAVL